MVPRNVSADGFCVTGLRLQLGDSGQKKRPAEARRCRFGQSALIY